MANPAGGDSAALQKHIRNEYDAGAIGHADTNCNGLDSLGAFW